MARLLGNFCAVAICIGVGVPGAAAGEGCVSRGDPLCSAAQQQDGELDHSDEPSLLQVKPSSPSSSSSLASSSKAASNVYNASSAPLAVCDFSASDSIWSRYMSAPKSGILRVQGDIQGQGVGNVFSGFPNALMLAMVSKRYFVIDYHIGQWELSEVLPASKNGPNWKYSPTPNMSCPTGAFLKDFDFLDDNTLPNDAVNIVTDVTTYPTVCYQGNVGSDELRNLLSMSLSIGQQYFTGCALNFLFDRSKMKKKLEPGVFNFVGHLRLGDSSAFQGFADTDPARGFLSNPTWGLHSVKDAGTKFVQCMQGVARSLLDLEDQPGCTILILSDSSEIKQYIQSQTKELQRPCAVKVAQGKAKHSNDWTLSKSEVQDVLTDLFSLGNADAAMLTHSMFGTIGSAMGPAMSDRSYAFEDFLKYYHGLQHNSKADPSFEDVCFSKASQGASVTFLESVRKYTKVASSVL